MYSLRPQSALIDWDEYNVNHAKTARKRARELSAFLGEPVDVRAADRTLYTVLPGGTCVPPDGAIVNEREICYKNERTCFCSPCRAARKDES